MMKNIAIYTLTSALHDEKAVGAATEEFLGSLHFSYELRGSDYSDYGGHSLNLIYVRTGGTEGVFRQLLPRLREQSSRPFYLLTSGKSNSLAASMEILSFLRQNDLRGEIIHGDANYISRRVVLLFRVETAVERLHSSRLGVIGMPSDWLISSAVDADVVRGRLGVELEKIEMDEVLQAYAEAEGVVDHDLLAKAPSEAIRNSLADAHRIYLALQKVVANHSLDGFTIRCFDLLAAVHNTGCLALARLNSEGVVAGCEGDVPAMLSMHLSSALLGISGFQANPSRLDPDSGEILFAHCTIPLNMVERYELDTHFESGIGVGIRGFMAEGPVTVFKLAADACRSFIAEGTLLRNQSEADLCRTQQVIRLDDASLIKSYFLTRPIGNHHIILPGHHREELEAFLNSI